MAIVWVLFRKEWVTFARDKVALAFTFLIPIALIYLFGNIFGGMGRSGGGVGSWRLGIVNESNSPLVAQLIDDFAHDKSFRLVRDVVGPDGQPRPLTATEMATAIRESTELKSAHPFADGSKDNSGAPVRFALVFPADATAMSEENFGLRVRLLTNPRNDIETQVVEGLIQRRLYSEVPRLAMALVREQMGTGTADLDAGLTAFQEQIADVVAQNFGGTREEVLEAMRRQTGGFVLGGDGTGTAEGEGNGFGLGSLIQLEREQVAGREVGNPIVTRQVGGWAMMFLLFSLSATARSLFDEKKAGLFLRLLTSPASRSDILWSKYLFGVSLGVLQLLILFLAGRLLFGIDIFSNFGPLVIVCVAAAFASVGFGMFIASIAPSPQSADALSTLLVLTVSAIGGAWFPTTMMPAAIQEFSKLSLVYWSMEAFLRVLWEKRDLLAIVPQLAVLVGIGGLTSAFALWRFHTGNIFR